jgi:hypothetical protein
MTTRAAYQIRWDVAARIVDIGGGWNLAPVPLSKFGPGLVPDSVPSSRGHLCFAVGMGVTTAGEGSSRDRQRVTEGAQATSELVVRFLARLTPKDQLASEDAAGAAELALIQQLLAVDNSVPWPRYFQVVWRDAGRLVVPSGEWFDTTVRFFVYHRIPLQ